MTDNDFLEAVLADGRWHGHVEILAESIRRRGHGLTVHSRASDLRKRGLVVETRLERNENGRTLSFYRLVALDEPSVAAIGKRKRADGSSSVPATDGVEQGPTGNPPLVEAAGALPLFACEVDESAGLRGAYWDDAA